MKFPFSNLISRYADGLKGGITTRNTDIFLSIALAASVIVWCVSAIKGMYLVMSYDTAPMFLLVYHFGFSNGVKHSVNQNITIERYDNEETDEDNNNDSNTGE